MKALALAKTAPTGAILPLSAHEMHCAAPQVEVFQPGRQREGAAEPPEAFGTRSGPGAGARISLWGLGERSAARQQGMAKAFRVA